MTAMKHSLMRKQRDKILLPSVRGLRRFAV